MFDLALYTWSKKALLYEGWPVGVYRWMAETHNTLYSAGVEAQKWASHRVIGYTFFSLLKKGICCRVVWSTKCGFYRLDEQCIELFFSPIFCAMIWKVVLFLFEFWVLGFWSFCGLDRKGFSDKRIFDCLLAMAFTRIVSLAWSVLQEILAKWQSSWSRKT